MRLKSVTAIVAALLVQSPLFAAGKTEHWQAFSTTAMSITGDIDLSPTFLRASGVTFPLKVAADVPSFGTDTATRAARILAVTRPMVPRLVGRNSLCGTDPVRWIVVWRVDRNTLGMAVFSSAKIPVSVATEGLCGTFYYTR